MAVLIVGVLYSKDADFDNAVSTLTKKYGPYYEGIYYPFTFTDYYAPEMGSDLKKKFVVFEHTMDDTLLSDIKTFTNELEDSFRVAGKRRVNLDPGFLTDKSLVLASVKPKSYKKAIGKGIYAHTVLKFEDNVRTFSHTFPDFKEDKVKAFFLDVHKTKVLKTPGFLYG